MTDAQLTMYSSWASLIGLGVSVVSLLYVRSIKKNIIKFRRKQRIRNLIEDVARIPEDATPLTSASRHKLAALKRNLPTYFWSPYTSRGKVTLEVHKHIDAGDLAAVKEAVNDWASYSEEV
ncbi:MULTISPECIES: hypothetical protein [Aeromonas]|uniref:hypothetical protein n=1 Tax=Aeromonas TaxID=642 RepID=UPI000448850A|nr:MULTISPECIES: hypothetical protein [Aeromonas]EZH81724.1 hypothetical protein AT59_13770 [Aeromonas hydrophila AD9]